ncbi:EAL domain-containing protein [Thaumasiovibrio sp. DFM-14]|uniref:EAL domain-containing protein n=1 Tax=Thaumasiovibrio sp. DFM-14 TaxID=3384792 RepID=UPI0039A30ED1
MPSLSIITRIINGFRQRSHPWIEALLIFVIGCMLIAAIHYPVGSYLLRSDVSSKLNSLIYHYYNRISGVESALNQLDKQLAFDCSDNDIQLIRQTTESSVGVQLIEVSSLESRCSQYGNNNVPEVDPNVPTLHHLNLPTHKISVYKNHRLNVEFQFPNATYRVITDPLPHIYIDHDKCQQCLTLSLVNHRGEHLYVYDMNPGQEYFPVAGQTLSSNLSLHIEGNAEAIKYYVSHWHFYLRLISVIALIVISLLWATRKTIKCSLTQLIDSGIKNDEFIPFYQPIVDAKNKQIVGCEALIRWVKPDGEIISPLSFIPHAETNGQIKPITMQLINKVVQHIIAPQWSYPSFYISLNITPEQLEDNGFAEHIIALLEKHHVCASSFAIEVTERTPFQNLSKAYSCMTKLDKHGIAIKLDDAGTGYGGFSYLQSLPIHTLKIDKMFIDTIGTKDLKRNILESIIQFGHTAGLTLIAEGVETLQQVDYLLAHNVHYMQGFYFGKAMPFEEFRHHCKEKYNQ